MIAGRAPANSGCDEGGSVKRLQLITPRPSRNTSTSRTPSVTKPTASEKSRKRRKSRLLPRSPRRRLRRLIGMTLIRAPRGSFVDLAELAHEPDRDEVHREGHDEQREPDREDGLVLDRAHR